MTEVNTTASQDINAAGADITNAAVASGHAAETFLDGIKDKLVELYGEVHTEVNELIEEARKVLHL